MHLENSLNNSSRCTRNPSVCQTFDTHTPSAKVNVDSIGDRATRGNGKIVDNGIKSKTRALRVETKDKIENNLENILLQAIYCHLNEFERMFVYDESRILFLISFNSDTNEEVNESCN